MPPDNQTSSEPSKSPTKKWNFDIFKKSPWLIVAILFIVCAFIVVIMKPWQSNGIRTISVTGQATLKAVPDEYIFNPEYDFNESSQQTALSDVTAKTQSVTAGLKQLGVTQNEIANNSSGYQNTYSSTNGTYSYTLNLTITIDNNKTLSQKVQNYLLSTDPSGQVTPSADFSQSQKTTLESQARTLAEANARTNALSSAKNLGFSLGGVKSVQDGGFNNSETGCFYDACVAVNAAVSATSSKNNLTLAPGENDLQYSVTVVYYIH